MLLLIAGRCCIVLAVLVAAAHRRRGRRSDAVPGLGFTLALPLVALLAATAVLGPEIDDGSIVYLLAKPVNRHGVAISKCAVALGATLLLGALPMPRRPPLLDRRRPGRPGPWPSARRCRARLHRAVPRDSRRSPGTRSSPR